MRKILTGAILGLALVVFPATGFSASSETYRQLELFGEVFERIKNDYVEELTDAELIEAAIDGMLTSLDPHSRYLNRKDFSDMQIETRGEFGGLGIEVTMDNGFVKVISPIDDTPAYHAGMQTGDMITHLDGESILGLTLDEAVQRMRGPVDSEIRLTVVREGEREPFDVTIIRATIKIKSVRGRREGGIAYIRISKFNEKTETELDAEVERLIEEIGPGIFGVILDLRNNPGGLLDQAIAVADAFLDQGEIVSTRGRRSDSIQRFNARKGDLANGLPIVVLINGGSASASEIVAGALKDHRRALILGTQSFGKGSVQTVIPVSEDGAIRLTTARYYTPSGESIQARGVEPDIVVEQAVIEDLNFPALSREADLRGSLLPEDQEDASEGVASPEGEDIHGEDDAAAVESPESRQDYQLSRALDLLNGLALLSDRSVD